MADAIITPVCDFLVPAFFSTSIKICLLKLYLAKIYFKNMKKYMKILFKNLVDFILLGWFSLIRPGAILGIFYEHGRFSIKRPIKILVFYDNLV